MLHAAASLLAPPLSPLVIGLSSLAVAIFFVFFGYLLVSVLFANRQMDSVVRFALAFPAIVAYAFVLTLFHIGSAGRVFSNPGLTRWVTVGITGTLALARLFPRFRKKARNNGATRDRRRLGVSAELACLATLIILGLLVWGSPVFRMLPLDSRGDIPMHMGWASQFLNGEPLPSGPLTGDIPNYYPWLYHALVALLAIFMPGGKAYVGMGVVQLLAPFGAITAFFSLGRHMTGKWTTGAAAALLGALAGGFGFLVARGPTIVENPRSEEALTYIGDFLSRRSYNLAFSNLSPPYPRDITYVLFPAFLLLVLVGLSRKRYGELIAAGSLLGLTGLMGAEVLIVGCGVVVLVAMLPGIELPRLKIVAAVLLPAVGLWSLWVVPLFVNYVQLGGFRSLAASPVTLPAASVFGSWGIAAPLAVVGGAVCVRRIKESPGVQVALLVVVVTGGLIVLPGGFEKVVGQGFKTLTRDHRFWPLLYGGVSLIAALGASWILERVWKRARVLSIAAGLLIAAVAISSPIAANLALPTAFEVDPALSASLRGQSATMLSLIDQGAGERRSLAVPRATGHVVFGYTGYRLTTFYWAKHDFGHIRWRRILSVIGGRSSRETATEKLTTGSSSPQGWKRLAQKYGVDGVIAERRYAASPAFRECRIERTVAPSRFIVIDVDSCE